MAATATIEADGIHGDEPAPVDALPRGEKLGALLEGLEPRLYAVAVGITRDPETARDSVQSGFEKAVRYRRSFRGQSRASTWVHRIVVNEALMSLRREQRRRRLYGDGDVADAIDESPGAVDELLVRERRLRVREALRKLRRPDRDVLEHCGLSGWSYAEYGARTGTHVSAVKSRAFRARRRLRELLEDAR